MKHLFRVLLKVVHRVAQAVPLRVVDVDHVLAGSNRQLFFRFHAVVVVAVDINLFACRRDLSPERLILHGLFIVKLLVRSLLKVLHRVAQVGLLLVIDLNNVLTFIRSNRQRAVLRLFELIPIFRLESESVFIDLTSVQRMDGIGFGIVYFAVVVMLNPIAVGVRPIVHVDNRVFATYELLHWIIITRISVAGYIFNIFSFYLGKTSGFTRFRLRRSDFFIIVFINISNGVINLKFFNINRSIQMPTVLIFVLIICV